MSLDNNALLPNGAANALEPVTGALALNVRPAERMFSGGDDENSLLNINELLRVLVRWKWLILGITLAAVVLAVLVTLATTPVYRASVTIEINDTTVRARSRVRNRARSTARHRPTTTSSCIRNTAC